MTLLRVTRLAKKETALGKLTLFVFGTIIGVALYSAYHILPFFYYYYELKNHMESLIKVASMYTDQELRAKLKYQLKKMEIPAEIEEVEFERGDRYMRITLDYTEVFFITWRGKDYDIHKFKFHVAAEGPF